MSFTIHKQATQKKKKRSLRILYCMFPYISSSLKELCLCAEKKTLKGCENVERNISVNITKAINANLAQSKFEPKW